ncbi:MAG: signal peptidase II [Coriobacteriales bacterium]
MSRRSSLCIFAVIAVVAVVLDRLSKAWAVAALPLGTTQGPNLGLVRLTMVHNTGAAFSIGDGFPLVFVGVALVIGVALIAYMLLVREHRALDVLAAGLILGGAIGNAVDRVLYQYVIDFIDFTFISFPVFNVADICVTCGVVLFMVYVIFFMDFGQGDEGAGDSKARGGKA